MGSYFLLEIIMDTTIKIYYLHKGDNIPFYIGETSQPLKGRLNNHRRKLGKEIQIELIEEVKNWRFWEKYWISQFKVWGFNLINKNEGGGGVDKGTPKHTPESKSKISYSRIGIKYSEESKQKISKALLGKKQSAQTCELKRIKRLGLKHSEISKCNISQNLSKPISQYSKSGDFIKTWTSTKLASEILNIYPSDISKCLKNKGKSAGGYIWKYN